MNLASGYVLVMPPGRKTKNTGWHSQTFFGEAIFTCMTDSVPCRLRPNGTLGCTTHGCPEASTNLRWGPWMDALDGDIHSWPWMGHGIHGGERGAQRSCSVVCHEEDEAKGDGEWRLLIVAGKREGLRDVG